MGFAIDVRMHDGDSPNLVPVPEQADIGIVEEHDGNECHREDIPVFAFSQSH